ncbi:MAG: hypothetical protein IKK75_09010 [Clostridia bacterium]|nr:hypothetical protein [Clostridia bacterium]
MAKSAPFSVLVHIPEDAAKKQQLARKTAQLHAEYVISSIRELKCPAEQKLALLERVIAQIKQTASE